MSSPFSQHQTTATAAGTKQRLWKWTKSCRIACTLRRAPLYLRLTDVIHSLQFDPAPRVGEPLVTRRVPDYFLVSCRPICPWSFLTWLCSDLLLCFMHLAAHP